MSQRYVDGLMRTVIIDVASLDDRLRILSGLQNFLIDLAGLDRCAFTCRDSMLYVRVYESARDRRAHRP